MIDFKIWNNYTPWWLISIKSYSLVISVLIFHELESSVHAVSKTIEGKWGTSASISLKDIWQAFGSLFIPS